MQPAHICAIALRNYKSFRDRTPIDLAPLTVLLGRNNTGKSSLIQPLLLMRQTLAVPRKEIGLNLTGEYVATRSLRDLTHGWPAPAHFVSGPTFEIEWESEVDLESAREGWLNANDDVVAERSGLKRLLQQPSALLRVHMRVDFAERDGAVSVEGVTFTLRKPEPASATIKRAEDGGYTLAWKGEFTAGSAHVTLDHFLPYIDVGRLKLGRNDYRRAYVNAWLSTFAPAIEALRLLLDRLQYLSSARRTPGETNEPITTPPLEVGADGNLAAAMFKARQADVVHYPPLPRIEADRVSFEDTIVERPFQEAVNDVLEGLGVVGGFKIEDAALFGYRLLFGKASLPHVGRGLTYLLPVVEVGLLGDPLRFQRVGERLTDAEYLAQAAATMPIALEEPESHLNPKVQSKLAHWLVALARAGRQVIVETHSDHLVRRLRGLIARAERGSDIERWLLENVRIYGVIQNDGVSEVKPLTLTATGELGIWPDDFLEEGSAEDSAIFYAGLAKGTTEVTAPIASPFIHDEGVEDEERS